MMFKIILPKLNLKIERWKWNKEYRIYVSTEGHFKDEHKQNIPILVDGIRGYCKVVTPYGIKQAHRLVMLTFKPIPNAEELTVDHLNHNKRDNSLSNLEWVTREENWARAKADLHHDELDFDKVQYIIAGKEKFKTLDSAINWAIAFTHSVAAPRETFAANIVKAIKNNKKYINRKWKVVMKED